MPEGIRPEIASDRAARPGSTASLRQALRSLRHRSHRLFFAGQLVSLVGAWIRMVAQSWLVCRLTGSEPLLSAIGFVGQIPILLFAPLGGVLADRVDRRRLLVMTQAASLVAALVLALLTLLGSVSVRHVGVTAFALGVVNAVDRPTRQAFVPGFAGRDDMVNAVALNSTTFNGARVVGPAIAGLLAMDVPPRPDSVRSQSTLDRIAEGFHFVWRKVPICGAA